MGEMAEYYAEQQLDVRRASVAKRRPLKKLPVRATAYYAHCMALYDTDQEQRDLVLVSTLGWRVLNPNAPEHQEGAMKARRSSSDPKASMLYFKPLVEGCDLLVFRGLPDGAVPAGVALEIEWAREHGMPVVELPSGILRRSLTREQTREYIREVGKW